MNWNSCDIILVDWDVLCTQCQRLKRTGGSSLSVYYGYIVAHAFSDMFFHERKNRSLECIMIFYLRPLDIFFLVTQNSQHNYNSTRNKFSGYTHFKYRRIEYGNDIKPHSIFSTRIQAHQVGRTQAPYSMGFKYFKSAVYDRKKKEFFVWKIYLNPEN